MVANCVYSVDDPKHCGFREHESRRHYREGEAMSKAVEEHQHTHFLTSVVVSWVLGGPQ